MPRILKDLEPKIVWELFEQISQIPRPSKKEEKIRAWVHDWARNQSIEVEEDQAGNILLKIPASEGCEDFPALILQAHMDMVPQKIPESSHNFDTDPIKLLIENDELGSFVTADSTTLGADNGIGMAIALTAASMPALQHGPLEVLLTVDEETGLTGAFALQAGFFSGTYLLNIDSDDFAEITISSAGGGDTKFSFPIIRNVFEGYEAIKLEVGGLVGGHSGVDIHLPRSNALKILISGLAAVREAVPIVLEEISGGTAHNAIPRNATATFLFPASELEKAVEALENWKEYIFANKEAEDAALTINFEETSPNKSVSFEETGSLLNLLSAIPHGPQSFIPGMEDVAETSNNLAIVRTHPDAIEISCSTRSSINEELNRVRDELRELGERHAAMVEQSQSYPGWQPDLSSPFLNFVKQKYEEVIQKEVKLRAVHGGLECGLFSRLAPDLQIASIGPEIKDGHSPQERVYIKTVEAIWKVVIRVIGNLNEL